MCVIAVSRSGSRLPTREEIRSMWQKNPDGAGYMFARSGEVVIHKGFMCLSDLEYALKTERFTKEDAVVYHFRISTQAGRTPAMTHPFPFSSDPVKMEALDLVCPLGIAHNGIIRMTSNKYETRFSDTALFIMNYLNRLIRTPEDFNDPSVLKLIDELGGWSKFAFLHGDGSITTVGTFTDDRGLLLSNTLHKITLETVKKYKFDYTTYLDKGEYIYGTY